jgi:hypothetical protein
VAVFSIVASLLFFQEHKDKYANVPVIACACFGILCGILVLVSGQNCFKQCESKLELKEEELHQTIETALTKEITAAGNMVSLNSFKKWRKEAKVAVTLQALAIVEEEEEALHLSSKTHGHLHYLTHWVNERVHHRSVGSRHTSGSKASGPARAQSAVKLAKVQLPAKTIV